MKSKKKKQKSSLRRKHKKRIEHKLKRQEKESK
nr:MAG TPA: hypothetical protein [Caudoviricetes sp.]